MKLIIRMIALTVIIGLAAVLLPQLVERQKTAAGMADFMAQSFADPAAVYCTEMGYSFQFAETEAGQVGICAFPDGSTCSAIAFLEGKCGEAFSYCAKQGLKQETRADGQNPFSPEYAVCVSADGQEVGAVSSLARLEEMATKSCGEAEIEEQELPFALDEPATAPRAGTVLPSSYDWRNRPAGNYLTNVKSQGVCGSCWAFSAVGATEAAFNISNRLTGNNFNLAEQYLVSRCGSGGTCCGGDKSSALTSIRTKGIPDEGCMAYVDGGPHGTDPQGCSCSDDTCDSNCTYSTSGSCSDRQCSNRCSNYARRLVQTTSVGSVSSDTDTIKNTLITKGPLSASMYYGATGSSWGANYTYSCPAVTGTNHAVVIVGYDDALGSWIIRNSWGPDQHDGGYFRIPYGQCNIQTKVYYVTHSGFNSSFNVNHNKWAVISGKWKHELVSYYTTIGLANKWSTIAFNAPYSPLTFEARLRRKGSDDSWANHLAIRGSPTTLRADKLWKNEYLFQYSNDGYFSVWVEKNGVGTALKSWTASTAIKKRGWNNLKVVANGATLQFYINGTLVWTGYDSTFQSGKVGIGMYRDSTSTGNKLLVDWAKLSIPPATLAPDSAEDAGLAPDVGEEVPGGDITHSP
ncbi:MAG: DUF333 domain-containing protein [Anaerolineales bacterium]|nr:DUF333 domain-containing protein [Anaerolineales bacterium]